MTMPAADLSAAIVSAWRASTLDDLFKAYWSTVRPTDFVTLHDQQAGPAQPFPYCIFLQEQGRTTGRMTGHSNAVKARFETRDVPLEFRIHARSITGSLRSAKSIAQELCEEVMKIYGGHPTVEPVDLQLTNGHVLQTTYEADWGIREGDHNHVWHLKYQIKVDVPVAV